MDLITQQSILAKLPEIQRRRRRAEQLKAQQQGFADMIASGQEETNYQPAQEGGWFKTVQQRRPDYGALGKQLAGGLGGLYTQHKAEKEAQGLDEYLNPEIIGAVGQIPQARDAQMQTQSGKPSNYQGANAPTLQAYLGMIGGPDVSGVTGSGNLRSTQKLKNGNLGLVYDSGVVDSGIPFDYSIKTEKNEHGDWFGIGTSGAGRGVANPIVPGDVAPPGGGIAGGMQFPQQQGGGFQSALEGVLRREGGLNPNDSGRGPSNFGINQAANPDIDVSKLTQEQAAQIYKERYWDKAGLDQIPPNMQPAVFDMAVNAGPDTARRLYEQSGGDPAAFDEARMQYYAQAFDPSRHTDADRQSWYRRVQETSGTQPPAGANATVSGPAAPAARGPLRSLTAAEEEAQKLAAQAGSAENITAIEQAKKEGALTAESIATAKAKLPGLRATQREMEQNIGSLLNSPVLDKIIGSSVSGRASALPGGRMINDFLLGAVRMEGEEGANMNAILSQLEDIAFVEGYAQEMKGTGAISNVEGLRTAQAKLRAARSQSPDAYRAALREFLQRHAELVAALERNAAGNLEPPSAPALAIPAGAQWLD